MTAIPVTNPTLAAVAYVKTAATVSDTIAAQRGATYLVNIECGATGTTVTFDDPTSVSPAGATQFNPDMVITVAPNTNKSVRLPANRFLNQGTGQIAVASATPTTTTLTVLGPL